MQAEANFSRSDWGLLAAVAAMWGSSFLFIRIGVEGLAPVLVAFGRVAFGAATLAAVPAARRPVPPGEWPALALLGAVWMAVPFVLFAVAEQSIDSALAGMLNAAAPLFTALVAAIAWRQIPGARRAIGLAVGFGGVIAISAPSLGEASASAVGAGLVVAATMLYGIAINLAGPLERRNGALAVIWRAQLVALVLLAPFAAVGVADSSFAPSSVLAVAALGCLGTAGAFVAFTTLVGRVGSTRASLAIYFIPAVAIALGALFRNETVAAISLLGTVLVLAGAYLASRAQTQGGG